MAEAAKLPTPDPQQPDNLDTNDLEKFGELVAEALLEIRKAIPAASDPVVPVVNLASPAINLAPVFQVPEQAPPNITVAPAAPNINVAASPPIINVAPGPAPSINLTTNGVDLGFDIAPIVEALNAIGQGIAASHAEMLKVIDAGFRQNAADAAKNGAQTAALTNAMTAPRELTMDENGKPTGVVIRKLN